MKPPGHALVSLPIGAVVWAATKSPYSMLAAFLTGVMLDLDHLVEYYWWFVRGDNTRVFYFFHSYELVVPAALAGYFSGWDPLVVGASAGFLGHLAADQIVNPMRPLAYFFTYRAIVGFRRLEIVNAEWADIQRDFLRPTIARAIIGFLNARLRAGK